MTSVAKITYLSALLIGLSVGLLLGYRSRLSDLESYNEARLITAPFALRDFSQLQYMHADSEHAKAALLTYANVLEAMEKAKVAKEQKLELSLTYTRLAVLEDNARNSEQSDAFMTKARYWYSAYGGRDLSQSEMKALLTRFDALQ
jgi:hypothetical protein